MTAEEIQAKLNAAFAVHNDEEEIRFDASLLHTKVMQQIADIIANEHISKKDLANKLDVSPSYITQLFTSDKLFGALLLAKLQKALDFKWEIRAERMLCSDLEDITSFRYEEKPVINMNKYLAGKIRQREPLPESTFSIFNISSSPKNKSKAS